MAGISSADLERIRRELDRHDPDVPIERAWTPPSSWYLDPAWFALEQRAVFGSSWLVVARADEVSEPGTYRAGRAGTEPIVVTCDRGGALRAFYNVCRHHAAIVADGAGCADALTCPYHGWSYHLDGRLRKAPRVGRIEEFDVSEFGLIPVRVARWRELVLVHLGEPDDAPGAALAELDRRLASAGTRPLRHVGSASYDIACNWKVFVDNYLDGGYHVPHAHHHLAGQLDLTGYRTEIFERWSVQSCPGQSEPGAAPAGRIGEAAVYAWLYPSFMINRYGHAMDTNLVIPLAPDRTRVEFEFYFEDGCGVTDRDIEQSLASADITQREDVALCESVQRGLGSRAYDRGRYAPELEVGEHHFHRLLARDLRLELQR